MVTAPTILAAETGFLPPFAASEDDYLSPAGAGERWGVLYTRSRREKRVARTCAYLGVRHYLPTRDHYGEGRRRRWYSVPVFASYVFACLNATARRELFDTRAISTVIPAPQARAEGSYYLGIDSYSSHEHDIASEIVRFASGRRSAGAKIRV